MTNCLSVSRQVKWLPQLCTLPGASEAINLAVDEALGRKIDNNNT